MATAITAMDKIDRHVKRLAGGRGRVKPGQPFKFNAAHQPGEGQRNLDEITKRERRAVD